MRVSCMLSHIKTEEKRVRRGLHSSVLCTIQSKAGQHSSAVTSFLSLMEMDTTLVSEGSKSKVKSTFTFSCL